MKVLKILLATLTFFRHKNDLGEETKRGVACGAELELGKPPHMIDH
jgi:hypothetical protein